MKRTIVLALYTIYQRIFARRLFAKWNRLLFQLSVRGLGVLNYGTERLTGERDFLRRFATRKDPLFVLDIGANEGQYSSALNELVPSATISRSPARTTNGRPDCGATLKIACPA